MPPAPPATLLLLALARSTVPFLKVLLVRSVLVLAWRTLEVCVPPVLVRYVELLLVSCVSSPTFVKPEKYVTIYRDYRKCL